LQDFTCSSHCTGESRGKFRVMVMPSMLLLELPFLVTFSDA